MTASSEVTELGASLAARFWREISESERNFSAFPSCTPPSGVLIRILKGSLSAISVWKPDRTKALAPEIASKSHFSGEIAGLRLSRRTGKFSLLPSLYIAQRDIIGQNELEKPQAHTSPIAELAALQKRMTEALIDSEVRAKENHLTVRELKHLPFKCAATLISAPKVSICLPSHQYRLFTVGFRVTTLMERLVVLPFEVFTLASIATGIKVWTLLTHRNTRSGS